MAAPHPAVRHLLPRPRLTGGDGAPIAFSAVRVRREPGCGSADAVLADLPPAADATMVGHLLEVVVGAGPGGEAWQRAQAGGLDPAGLPPEGYAILVERSRAGAVAVLAGADPAGAFYAAGTLRQLIGNLQEGGAWTVPEMAVRDWPELSWRGTVEGFYGPPWTHADRLDLLRFAGRHRLNTFVYAPKDDPYHREQWREVYPAAELARIRELVETAASQHVRFVYALAPGLTMGYAAPRELALLVAKAEQLWDVGVREFSLLFDDIPFELRHADDVAAFGQGAGAAGAAHARVCAGFISAFLDRHPGALPLTMCPTDYAGTASTPYREQLARELPDDVLVWWTGSDVVVGEVTRRDVDEAAASYGHRLLLWDNFPVNDFDRTRLFLGPLTGRTADLTDAPLVGISANPMVEAAPSQLALATVADYAWNPHAYDPADAARRALALVAGGDAAPVAPLVKACSGWPPDAPQHPELDALISATLDGDADAAASLRARFSELVAGAEALHDRTTRLVDQLRPWLRASVAMARAGELAVRLLDEARARSVHGSALAAEHALLTSALREAESHHANVLRGHVPAFVRTVLQRTGAPAAPDDTASEGEDLSGVA